MKDILHEDEFRPELAPKHARIFATCMDYLIYFIILGVFYGEWYKPGDQGIQISLSLADPDPIASLLL